MNTKHLISTYTSAFLKFLIYSRFCTYFISGKMQQVTSKLQLLLEMTVCCAEFTYSICSLSQEAILVVP